MNKQIEEMANIIYDKSPIHEMWVSDATIIAEAIYNEGYRKASEVAREIFAELKTVMMDEYRYPIIAELKKKYIGEQE